MRHDAGEMTSRHTPVAEACRGRHTERNASHMRRLGLTLMIVATLVLPSAPSAPVLAQTCQLSGGFAHLLAQVPDRVVPFQGTEVVRPGLGVVQQPTSTGGFVCHTLDAVLSLRDRRHV